MLMHNGNEQFDISYVSSYMTRSSWKKIKLVQLIASVFLGDFSLTCFYTSLHTIQITNHIVILLTKSRVENHETKTKN